MVAVYYGVVGLSYSGTYQGGENSGKFEVSAEVFKRLLFTGDVEGLNDYFESHYGLKSDILRNGWASAITDQHLPYFTYLALIKLTSDHPLTLHFFLGVLMFLSGLLFLTHALAPPDKPFYFLVAGLTLSPFIIFHAWIYDAHALQVFCACAGLWLFSVRRFYWAFFMTTLAFFAHRSALPLVGCLGLYLLIRERRNWRVCLAAALGGLSVWGLMELLMFALRAADGSHNLLVHTTYAQLFLGSFTAAVGDYARVGGQVSYVKNLFLLMPLGMAGVLWVRSWFQAVTTILPLALFFYVGHGELPSAMRVLLPYFVFGHAFFWLRLLEVRPGWVKRAGLVLVGFAAILSASYLAVTSQCMNLAEGRGEPVAKVDTSPSLPIENARLFWNLRRFHPIVPDAPVVYTLRPLNRLELPNIPDPNGILPNLAFMLVGCFFPQDSLSALGSLTPQPSIPFLERRAASPVGEQPQ
ncbi:hypothetical protein [Fundidesulfovibrio magnetotacticus]|uniref:hypothetical protein n=1 Tax=Fundidesulfovibrio magnetotacticus TaxID=2730080 RepID=UPI001C26DC52|nr:hypothetical protein [Fundidesulfovibrio magnetotacticus]